MCVRLLLLLKTSDSLCCKLYDCVSPPRFMMVVTTVGLTSVYLLFQSIDILTVASCVTVVSISRGHIISSMVWEFFLCCINLHVRS